VATRIGAPWAVAAPYGPPLAKGEPELENGRHGRQIPRKHGPPAWLRRCKRRADQGKIGTV